MIRFTIGINKIDSESVKVNHREAVRAVIANSGNILMVKTNKGDYKFPGGGINRDENHEEALVREVMEETGHIVIKINERIGEITQRNYNDSDEGSIFEMISFYYFCEVSENKVMQKLDNYEADLDFCPIWVDIDTAISNNLNILKGESKDINPWVYRETAFLEELKNILKQYCQ